MNASNPLVAHSSSLESSVGMSSPAWTSDSRFPRRRCLRGVSFSLSDRSVDALVDATEAAPDEDDLDDLVDFDELPEL